MKNNRLVINDTEYILDADYRRGALARRDNFPWALGALEVKSDAALEQWDRGHENEDQGFHVVDGTWIIVAPRNGTVYHVVY